MSPINIALAKQQSDPEKQREVEANLNTDLYSTGYFEGYIGLEPSILEDNSYWSGYQLGSREYWAKKLGVEIPTQF